VRRRGLVYWTDRALGAHILPNILRNNRVQVVRHVETFPDDDRIADLDWIPEIASRGWIIVTKDAQIRRNRIEREMLIACGALYVSLGKGNLTGEQQAERFLRHRATLDAFFAGASRGPHILSARLDDVHRLDGERWEVVPRVRRYR